MKKYVFESLKFFCAAILCTILSTFATPSWGALPSGYTQLEYINMQAGSYLQTDIVPTYDGRIEMDFQTTSLVSYSSNLGGRSNTTQGAGLNFGYVSNKFVLDAFSSSRYTSDVAPVANTRYNFTFNNKVATLESGGTTLFTNTFTGENANGAALAINAFNNVGTVVNNTAGIYLYSFKVWNGQGTLIANFIPAKNASGVVGMYDTVSGQFFTNAGTGEFIAGDPVTTCDGTVVNYTSATGTGVQNGTPTPDNPIYPTFYKQGDMVLRKVGDIADSYDATTGKITRRVGEYIFTGRESIDVQYNVYGVTTIPYDMNKVTNASLCSHNKTYINSLVTNDRTFDKFLFFTNVNRVGFGVSDTPPEITNTETFKQWLAAQYAAGTPVTIYYPLETETTEDWPASQCTTEPIKIATTKYNETAFSPLNTALQNAISVVDTVVSNTITQAGRIATLQAQKQTRPNDIADDNEKCPAGKKCLLVEDASGVPHWYEIVERYSRLPDGYMELEYIESTGTQYIDTGVVLTDEHIVDFKFMGTGNFFGTRGNAGASFGATGSTNLSVDLFESTGVISSARLSYTIDPNSIYMIHMENGNKNLKDANGTVLGRNTYESTSFTTTYTAPIFTIRWQSSTPREECGNFKLYYFKIYDANGLVRDFVPAKRGDVVGMYDLADPNPATAFYTNAGTGEFIAGDPVVE